MKMRWWRFGSIFALTPVIIFAIKPSDDPFGGAICENTVSAFFVSDNTNVIWEGKVLNIENITEDACKEVCINNKDLKGRSLLCASFTYDHVTFQCTIYRQRSLPDGTLARQYAPGKRYFEKFCVSEDQPIECANTMFIRADESIIKGYAKNTSIVPSMEECAARCMREEFDCKSAMYFYEEGECITNIESAMTKPDDFGHPDDGDKVVYFQNGCTREYLASIKEQGHKSVEKEMLFEVTSPAPGEAAPAETEMPKTEEPEPEKPEEPIEEKPKPKRKHKGSRRQENIEVEETPVVEETPAPEQPEGTPPTPSTTDEDPKPKKAKKQDTEAPKPKKNRRKQKPRDEEVIPQEPEVTQESASEHTPQDSETFSEHSEAEKATPEPESSTPDLKGMDKDLLDLLNESQDAVKSLGASEEQEKPEEPAQEAQESAPEPQKKSKSKSRSRGKTRHESKPKSDDEKALEEMQEIREMVRDLKKEKEEEKSAHREEQEPEEAAPEPSPEPAQETQEPQEEESTPEPPKKKPKSNKRKQPRVQESQEEEPKPSEDEEEQPKKRVKVDEEKESTKKQKEEERREVQEEVPEEQPQEQEEEEPQLRHRSHPKGVKKNLYGAKQVRKTANGDLRELSLEQDLSDSDPEPHRPKQHGSRTHPEPLPIAEQDQNQEQEPEPFPQEPQEQLQTIPPSRARKLGIKQKGEPRRINIRPLKQNSEEEHDFTDPARARGQDEEVEEQDEVDGYFSKWGEWTKCTHAGERRIRRRKCLDLRKCKGALMQVSYCPKELPEEVEASPDSLEEPQPAEEESREPSGPVRRPLPVESDSSENGHPPGIMPPNLPEKELKPLPVGAPGSPNEVWSPWLGVCQQFASTQPCKNGKVIGFESRECIAKDPKLCKGPFFRYCTLPC